MLTSRVVVCLGFACLLGGASSSIAHAQPRQSAMYAERQRVELDPYAALNLTEEQLRAATELEAAQLRFLQWSHFEFPARIQAIDSQIAVVQQEMLSFQRRQASFKRFDVWVNDASPLFETSENVGLALIAAQQRLSQLQYERGMLLQQQPLEYRIRQAEVDRARLHLRRMF